jgi:hypothetical protein
VGPAVLAGIVRKDAVARVDLNQFKRYGRPRSATRLTYIKDDRGGMH